MPNILSKLPIAKSRTPSPPSVSSQETQRQESWEDDHHRQRSKSSHMSTSSFEPPAMPSWPLDGIDVDQTFGAEPCSFVEAFAPSMPMTSSGEPFATTSQNAFDNSASSEEEPSVRISPSLLQPPSGAARIYPRPCLSPSANQAVFETIDEEDESCRDSLRSVLLAAPSPPRTRGTLTDIEQDLVLPDNKSESSVDGSESGPSSPLKESNKLLSTSTSRKGIRAPPPFPSPSAPLPALPSDPPAPSTINFSGGVTASESLPAVAGESFKTDRLSEEDAQPVRQADQESDSSSRHSASPPPNGSDDARNTASLSPDKRKRQSRGVLLRRKLKVDSAGDSGGSPASPEETTSSGVAVVEGAPLNLSDLLLAKQRAFAAIAAQEAASPLSISASLASNRTTQSTPSTRATSATGGGTFSDSGKAMAEYTQEQPTQGSSIEELEVVSIARSGTGKSMASVDDTVSIARSGSEKSAVSQADSNASDRRASLEDLESAHIQLAQVSVLLQKLHASSIHKRNPRDRQESADTMVSSSANSIKSVKGKSVERLDQLAPEAISGNSSVVALDVITDTVNKQLTPARSYNSLGLSINAERNASTDSDGLKVPTMSATQSRGNSIEFVLAPHPRHFPPAENTFGSTNGHPLQRSDTASTIPQCRPAATEVFKNVFRRRPKRLKKLLAKRKAQLQRPVPPFDSVDEGRTPLSAERPTADVPSSPSAGPADGWEEVHDTDDDTPEAILASRLRLLNGSVRSIPSFRLPRRAQSPVNDELPRPPSALSIAPPVPSKLSKDSLPRRYRALPPIPVNSRANSRASRASRSASRASRSRSLHRDNTLARSNTSASGASRLTRASSRAYTPSIAPISYVDLLQELSRDGSSRPFTPSSFGGISYDELLEISAMMMQTGTQLETYVRHKRSSKRSKGSKSKASERSASARSRTVVTATLSSGMRLHINDGAPTDEMMDRSDRHERTKSERRRRRSSIASNVSAASSAGMSAYDVKRKVTVVREARKADVSKPRLQATSITFSELRRLQSSTSLNEEASGGSSAAASTSYLSISKASHSSRALPPLPLSRSPSAAGSTHTSTSVRRKAYRHDSTSEAAWRELRAGSSKSLKETKRRHDHSENDQTDTKIQSGSSSSRTRSQRRRHRKPESSDRQVPDMPLPPLPSKRSKDEEIPRGLTSKSMPELARRPSLIQPWDTTAAALMNAADHSDDASPRSAALPLTPDEDDMFTAHGVTVKDPACRPQRVKDSIRRSPAGRQDRSDSHRTKERHHTRREKPQQLVDAFRCATPFEDPYEAPGVSVLDQGEVAKVEVMKGLPSRPISRPASGLHDLGDWLSWDAGLSA